MALCRILWYMGWYDPWYYGYGGFYNSWYYPYPRYTIVGGGHHSDIARHETRHGRGWSNRGRAYTSTGVNSVGDKSSNNINSRNVYNNIARRQETMNRAVSTNRHTRNNSYSYSNSGYRQSNSSWNSNRSQSNYSGGYNGGSSRSSFSGGGSRGAGGGSHGGRR